MELLIKVFVPLVIILIMLAVGIGTPPKQFIRLLQQPKPLLLGLLLQWIMVPVVGVVCALVFQLDSSLTLGLLLLSACPGGSSSNAFTFISAGRTELSVGLTAVSSLFAVVTLPLVFTLGTGIVLGNGALLELDVSGMIVKMFVVTTLPLVIGLAIRGFLGERVEKAKGTLSRVVGAGLVCVIVLAIWENRSDVLELGAAVLPAVTAFTGLTFILSYIFTKKADRKSRISLVYECGFQNTGLCVFIAMTLLQDQQMALPAGMNTFPMFIFAGLYFLKLKKEKTNARI